MKTVRTHSNLTAIGNRLLELSDACRVCIDDPDDDSARLNMARRAAVVTLLAAPTDDDRRGLLLAVLSDHLDDLSDAELSVLGDTIDGTLARRARRTTKAGRGSKSLTPLR